MRGPKARKPVSGRAGIQTAAKCHSPTVLNLSGGRQVPCSSHGAAVGCAAWAAA